MLPGKNDHGVAPEENVELANIKDTALLNEMTVPGLLNSPQRPPTLAERAFKKMLGLKGS